MDKNSSFKPAPASAASEPLAVIPPDTPMETDLPLVIRRGCRELSTPSSVAQVSAFAAANAPAPATAGDSRRRFRFLTSQLRDNLIDRATRHKLDDGKGHQHDTE